MPTIHLPDTLTRRQRRAAVVAIRTGVLHAPAFNGATLHVEDTTAPCIWADCSPRLEADVLQLINAANAAIQAIPARVVFDLRLTRDIGDRPRGTRMSRHRSYARAVQALRKLDRAGYPTTITETLL